MLTNLFLTESVRDSLLESLENDLDKATRDLLGKDLFEQLKILNARYDVLFSRTSNEYGDVIKDLQIEIRTETLQHGVTVKSEHYMSVFTQPKPAWDGSKLEGYAVAHPEILAFRKEKNPYVSIRKVKK